MAVAPSLAWAPSVLRASAAASASTSFATPSSASSRRRAASSQLPSSSKWTSGEAGAHSLAECMSTGRKRSPHVQGITCLSTLEAPSAPTSIKDEAVVSKDSNRPLRVLVAGGGIGGLVFALAAKRRGFDVRVYERESEIVRGEGNKYRGPIQVQSNALAALEAIDQDVAERIKAAGTVTGDRINGLVDGLTGKWYCKFDTWHPAVDSGLPVTRVISRFTLLEILTEAVGPDCIEVGRAVVGFKEDASGKQVTAIFNDGSEETGDLLVGADGIWSKVRRQLFGHSEPVYSDYTCYTGIADFRPPDLDAVGYRVFLGNKKYFVSSDVGHGKMQWYAFSCEPAGGKDEPDRKKQRILEIFDGWCAGVTDLVEATPEPEIIRRDIYDRAPIFSWSKGRVALLGDSAHAMQPNMGQGGCMAIEDSYQLALDLCEELEKASEKGLGVDGMNMASVLKHYERERIPRAGAIHGMARMAAIMASTYKAYLGEGLGPLKFIQQLKIPHPGSFGGKVAMGLFMQPMLKWVLGGNNSHLLRDRAPRCSITELSANKFDEFYKDDDALEKSVQADWILTPIVGGFDSVTGLPSPHCMNVVSSRPFFTLPRSGQKLVIGSSLCDSSKDVGAVLDHDAVCPQHACIECFDDAFFVTDLGSKKGTKLNRKKLAPFVAMRIHPGDVLEFGAVENASYRIKFATEPVMQDAQQPALTSAA
eukprot:jgi/Chlat1/7112/Chrsp57S06795